MSAAPRVVDEDFLWAGTAVSDALRGRDFRPLREVLARPGEVRCAAREMERAWAATNSEVALRRAPSAGESETRNSTQEEQRVVSGMVVHASERDDLT